MSAPEIRSVVDRVENGWEYGHRESREDGGSPWRVISHSDYVRVTTRAWFQKKPIDIMRENMGFETTKERASEFAAASDSNSDLWYYLAAATPPETGDEALKWIMGALAAEANVRDLRFTDIPSLLPAPSLSRFVAAIVDGSIDRTFTKVIFAELLQRPRMSDEAFEALRAEPRFKPVSADDLEPIITKVIADNPEQFEKAKANPKLVQFFVGQVMKATQGKAPPPKVLEIMNRKLAE